MGLTENVTLKQRPEDSRGVSHVSILGSGKLSMCKDPLVVSCSPGGQCAGVVSKGRGEEGGCARLGQ